MDAYAIIPHQQIPNTHYGNSPGQSLFMYLCFLFSVYHGFEEFPVHRYERQIYMEYQHKEEVQENHHVNSLEPKQIDTYSYKIQIIIYIVEHRNIIHAKAADRCKAQEPDISPVFQFDDRMVFPMEFFGINIISTVFGVGF